MVLVLACNSLARGQEWARKMFEKTSHNFGTVVSHAKTEYRFRFKNLYVEDLHVAGVRTSCGCTTPEISKRDLKTYEVGEIIARFNTHAFTGHRSATVTVTFDKPFYAEVQLQVSGYIRGDIAVQPNVVNLGTVDEGQEVERHITVSANGRPNWQIVDVRSANSHFEVEPILRSRTAGQVLYDLKVTLKPDAPPGIIKEQLILVSNDNQSATFPVEVEGRVVPELTLTRDINFGPIAAGDKRTKVLSVRGRQPFKILSITANDDRISFRPLGEGAEARTNYQIPITFTADDRAGKVTEKLVIETDRGKSALTTTIRAEVRADPTTEPEAAEPEVQVTKPDQARNEALRLDTPEAPEDSSTAVVEEPASESSILAPSKKEEASAAAPPVVQRPRTAPRATANTSMPARSPSTEQRSRGGLRGFFGKR